MPMTAHPNVSAVNDAVDDSAEETRSFAERATDAVSDGVSNAADFVSDGVRSATAQIPKLGEWVDDQLTRAGNAVQERPIQTLAIVAGVAALVGAIFARR